VLGIQICLDITFLIVARTSLTSDIEQLWSRGPIQAASSILSATPKDVYVDSTIHQNESLIEEDIQHAKEERDHSINIDPIRQKTIP